MNEIQSITLKDDVTLISLQDSPADIALVSQIFQMISDAGIDVDMISQTPPHGSIPSLSFTVSGEDFGKVLGISTELRELNPELKLNVSSGNCKISIFGEAMRGTPGVAAKVFSAVSKVNADIRMITTSEVDISLLVVKADADVTVDAIREIFA